MIFDPQQAIELAAVKRDSVIAAAHKEYNELIQAIEVVCRLAGCSSPSVKSSGRTGVTSRAIPLNRSAGQKSKRGQGNRCGVVEPATGKRWVSVKSLIEECGYVGQNAYYRVRNGMPMPDGRVFQQVTRQRKAGEFVNPQNRPQVEIDEEAVAAAEEQGRVREAESEGLADAGTFSESANVGSVAEILSGSADSGEARIDEATHDAREPSRLQDVAAVTEVNPL